MICAYLGCVVSAIIVILINCSKMLSQYPVTQILHCWTWDDGVQLTSRGEWMTGPLHLCFWTFSQQEASLWSKAQIGGWDELFLEAAQEVVTDVLLQEYSWCCLSFKITGVMVRRVRPVTVIGREWSIFSILENAIKLIKIGPVIRRAVKINRVSHIQWCAV